MLPMYRYYKNWDGGGGVSVFVNMHIFTYVLYICIKLIKERNACIMEVGAVNARSRICVDCQTLACL